MEHIIIIGGTSGSGRALVRQLLADNHAVSVIGRKPSPEVYDKLRGLSFFAADISDLTSLRAALRSAVKLSGSIKGLVFYQRYRGREDSWSGEFQVSLTATKETIEMFAELFDNSSLNSIVVVGSSAGVFIHHEQPLSYHVAKAALKQMVRYYAYSLGQYNIRVNSVSPATVIKDESKAFYEVNKELRELYESITPLKRMGNANDVANTVYFLLSDNSSFITGQDIVVDGGISLSGQTSIALKLSGLDKLKITR